MADAKRLDVTASRSPGKCVPATENSEPLPPPAATTITTLQQAYECILANSYDGPLLDSRTVLFGGFQAFVAELQNRGADQPTASLPKLSGDHGRDWAAFAKMYKKVLAALPEDAALRQALAAATLRGMVASLNENHAGWDSRQQRLGAPYGLGIVDAPTGRITSDITQAKPPLYVKAIDPGSPADKAGLKPGDILVAVNDIPLAINGVLTVGALEWLHPRSPDVTVRLKVQRPATDRTWEVELRAAVYAPPGRPAVSATVISGDIAYAVLPQFSPGFTDALLKKIATLRETTKLRGIILDVRGNPGGRQEEGAKLLGAFAHGKVMSWSCEGDGRCTPVYTDDTTPLLKLPLVLLTDSICASACDDLTGAVKDLKLGKVVGVRTAGKVSGLPSPFLLNDNTVLHLVRRHHASSGGGTVNEVGVAVDYQAPTTAQDLSAGRDPAVTKALDLLAP